MVPVAGIIGRKQNSGLSDGARNSGGMTDRDKLKLWNMQAYPSTPRRSWTGRVALGLSIAAVIALWAGVALADAADLAGFGYPVCED